MEKTKNWLLHTLTKWLLRRSKVKLTLPANPHQIPSITINGIEIKFKKK